MKYRGKSNRDEGKGGMTSTTTTMRNDQTAVHHVCTQYDSADPWLGSSPGPGRPSLLRVRARGARARAPTSTSTSLSLSLLLWPWCQH